MLTIIIKLVIEIMYLIFRNILCNYHFQMYMEQHLVHSICSSKYSSSQHQNKNTGLNIKITKFEYVTGPAKINHVFTKLH